MESEIDGENNQVQNAQKIDILSPNVALNGGGSCEVWSSYGFELFEYLILSFLNLNHISSCSADFAITFAFVFSSSLSLINAKDSDRIHGVKFFLS